MPHSRDVYSVQQLLGGVLILWVAWFGFNASGTGGMSSASDVSSALNAVVTTTISGSAGGVAAMLVSRWRSLYVAWRRGMAASHTEVDVLHLANGILSGLVAITAGCDVVSAQASVVIGVVAGVVYPFATRVLASLRVDDVVDAVPVHFVSGVWGTIAVGLWDQSAGLLVVGRWALLRSQTIGCIALIIIASGVLAPVVLVLNRFGWLRVDMEVEARGLDSKFGIAASVHDSEKLLRLKEASAIIHHYGFDVAQLIRALNGLRDNIARDHGPRIRLTCPTPCSQLFARYPVCLWVFASTPHSCGLDRVSCRAAADALLAARKRRDDRGPGGGLRYTRDPGKAMGGCAPLSSHPSL